MDDDTKEIKSAFKETIMNLERLIEEAERALRRARERFSKLFPDDDYYSRMDE